MKPNTVYHHIAGECFKNAADLLSSEGSLTYTALELRRCIEALAYRRLSEFIDDLGGKDRFKDWQPKKVMDAIESIDPKANMPSILTMYKQNNAGKADGAVFSSSFTPVSPAIIKKHYQYLSSLIHTPTLGKINSKKDQEDLKRKLMEILDLLKPSVFTPLFGVRFKSKASDFQCDRCSGTVLVSPESIKERTHIHCYHCDAAYIFRKEGDKYSYHAVGQQLKCIHENCNGHYFVWEDYKLKSKPVECDKCMDRQAILVLTPKS